MRLAAISGQILLGMNQCRTHLSWGWSCFQYPDEIAVSV